MSTPFQNRLVGTIIVAAAVIIFLPDLLDGKKASNQASFEAMPQAPEFTGEIIKKPFPDHKVVLKEEAKAAKEIALDEKLTGTQASKGDSDLAKENKVSKSNSDTSKVTPGKKAEKINTAVIVKEQPKSPISKPALGKQPPKSLNQEAWVIQLGSFKHKSNVAELVAKLKRNGYTVFTKPIKTKKGTLTKVCVGPELIKTSLIKKIPALKKLTNVQGKIARFYPTK